MTGKLVLLRRWWRGQIVIRFGPSSQVFDLWIEHADGKHYHFIATSDPRTSPALAFLTDTPERWIDERGRPVDPFTIGTEPVRLRPQSDGNPTKDTPCFVERLAVISFTTIEDEPAVKRFALKDEGQARVLQCVRETSQSGFWELRITEPPAPTSRISKHQVPLAALWKVLQAEPACLEFWPGLSAILLRRPSARTEILNFGLDGLRWVSDQLVKIAHEAAPPGTPPPVWLREAIQRFASAHITDFNPAALLDVAGQLGALCWLDLALAAPIAESHLKQLTPELLDRLRLIVVTRQPDRRLQQSLHELQVVTGQGAPIAWLYTNLGEVAALQAEGELLKADEEQRIVYGIVLKPDIPDAQGDVFSAREIERVAHRYLVKSRLLDWRHRETLPQTKTVPVESYIAPTDLTINGKTVPKGAWVMATHVPDDALWAEIKAGQIRAYSIRGFGMRKLLKEHEHGSFTDLSG